MPAQVTPSRYVDCRMRVRLVPGILIMVLLSILIVPSRAPAADRTWTGNGADNKWDTAGNWLNSNKPVNDDRVIFDNNSQARLDNINDIVGLTGMEIKVVNPTGDVTINDIGGTGTLVLATTDPAIDLSTAEKNLTIETVLILQGATAYSVKAGRTLTLGDDVNGQFKVTKRGGGRGGLWRHPPKRRL